MFGGDTKNERRLSAGDRLSRAESQIPGEHDADDSEPSKSPANKRLIYTVLIVVLVVFGGLGIVHVNKANKLAAGAPKTSDTGRVGSVSLPAAQKQPQVDGEKVDPEKYKELIDNLSSMRASISSAMDPKEYQEVIRQKNKQQEITSAADHFADTEFAHRADRMRSQGRDPEKEDQLTESASKLFAAVTHNDKDAMKLTPKPEQTKEMSDTFAAAQKVREENRRQMNSLLSSLETREL